MHQEVPSAKRVETAGSISHMVRSDPYCRIMHKKSSDPSLGVCFRELCQSKDMPSRCVSKRTLVRSAACYVPPTTVQQQMIVRNVSQRGQAATVVRACYRGVRNDARGVY